MRTWPFFLYWKLFDCRQKVRHITDEILKNHCAMAAHPIRLQRYWWAARSIEDEQQRLGRKLVVADLGCGSGWLRRLVDDHIDVNWIGLDCTITSPDLSDAGYDELRRCNLDKSIALSSASADIVVSLHVFEHLEHPEKSLREVWRVLRPGGFFVGGTPVVPSLISYIRTYQLKKRPKRAGKAYPPHIQSFSPRIWRRLLNESGFHVDFVTGSHFTRLSGHWLERQAWWIRVNQLWGWGCPSLGSEVYFKATKSPLEEEKGSGVFSVDKMSGKW